MYLPLAAVVVLVVLACYAVLRRCGMSERPRDGVRRQLDADRGALLLRTAQRNREYCDLVQLWSQTIAVAPHNYRAHFNLGRAHSERGDDERARGNRERARGDEERARLHDERARFHFERERSHYEEACG